MSKKYEKLFDDLYLIKDMCNCYLLIGDQKALLVDTGVGLVDIKKIVQEITDKPVVVVNSHAHFDHFGGNSSFDQVLVHKEEQGVAALHNSAVFRKFFLSKVPFFVRLILSKKLSKPIELNYHYVDANEEIDLGNRKIKWIHTPGHTRGSSCFFDEKEGYFFGADTLVPRLVLLNLDYSCSPVVFKESMLKIKELQNQINYVLPGHHMNIADKTLIDDYLDVVEKAIHEVGDITNADVGVAEVYHNNVVQLFCKADHRKN